MINLDVLDSCLDLIKENKGAYSINITLLVRTPINLPRLLISKSLYTNTTIIWYGFFYYLDVTRA